MNRRKQHPEGRAARDLKQDLAAIDLVVELLDARAPLSSQNPRVARLTAGKERLILLHKADRGDSAATTRWINHFRDKGCPALAFSIYHPPARRALFKHLQKRRANLSPAFGRRSLRAMVVGIPNVGKSSFINCLVRRRAARSGDRPGITRGRQWIKVLPGIELLDTPGVLDLGLTKKEQRLPLSAIGALSAAGMEAVAAARWLLTLYREKGEEGLLVNRYRDLVPDSEADLQLEQIGQSRGCLLPAGKIDLQRAAELLLRDYQNGSIGRVTLELPPG